MADKEIKKLFMEDGRRGEEHVSYSYIDGDNCHAEKVVEVWAEEARPLKLEKKVKERTKPYVYEREIEIVDPNTGEVKESWVESTDPQVNMQKVSHIKTYDDQGKDVGSEPVIKVQAHDMVEEPEKDCVTKDDVIEAVRAGISAYHRHSKQRSPQLSAQAVMQERMAKKDDLDVFDYGMIFMIVAQIAFLGYFFYG